MSNFHSHFLSNLERLCFGGGGEKIGGSHQNLSSFPPSTKQPKTSFSLHFSLLHFPSSLKSLQTNIALSNSLSLPFLFPFSSSSPPPPPPPLLPFFFSIASLYLSLSCLLLFPPLLPTSFDSKSRRKRSVTMWACHGG